MLLNLLSFFFFALALLVVIYHHYFSCEHHLKSLDYQKILRFVLLISPQQTLYLFGVDTWGAFFNLFG
jgi:hypothetical protein